MLEMSAAAEAARSVQQNAKRLGTRQSITSAAPFGNLATCAAWSATPPADSIFATRARCADKDLVQAFDSN